MPIKLARRRDYSGQISRRVLHGQIVKNNLLSKMPEREFARLAPHLKFCASKLTDVLGQQGGPIKTVYFVNEGIASMLVETLDGRSVEVGISGREGMVGMPLSGGIDEYTYKIVVQVPGTAFEVKAPVLQKLLPSLPGLYQLLVRGLAILNLQFAHNAACNRLHTIDQRLSRWLLVTHDRLNSDTVRSTHDFLARMVGTDRPTVTLALSRLQAKEAIQQQRGMIAIRNRKMIEKISCECYGAYRRVNKELGLRT